MGLTATSDAERLYPGRLHEGGALGIGGVDSFLIEVDGERVERRLGVWRRWGLLSVICEV